LKGDRQFAAPLFFYIKTVDPMQIMFKENLLALISVFFLSTLFLVFSSCASYGSKPASPLSITIRPADKSLMPQDIREGDTLVMDVTVLSMADLDRVKVNLKLTGGIMLVQGDLSWTGSMTKGESKNLLITVKIPEMGHGKIKGTVVAKVSGNIRFSDSASFIPGKLAKEKSTPLPLKKDGRGRPIIEHRL